MGWGNRLMRIGILGFSTVDIRIPIRTAHLHHSISRVACERIGRARVLECDGKGIVFLERRNRVVLLLLECHGTVDVGPNSDVCIE